MENLKSAYEKEIRTVLKSFVGDKLTKGLHHHIETILNHKLTALYEDLPSRLKTNLEAPKVVVTIDGPQVTVQYNGYNNVQHSYWII